MTFNTDYKVEDYIISAKYEDMPPEVQERAKVVAIDLMIALILGSQGEQFKNGLAMAEHIYQKGNIPVIGNSAKLSLMGAVNAMGHASNSYDIDDCYSLVKGHVGAVVVGPVLATALHKDVSYKEYLTALAIGYDVGLRTAFAMQEHYNYYFGSGSWGATGVAASMGKLLGLTKEQLNTAMSIADYHAPTTPVMRGAEYPSMNKDGVPFGVLVGSNAVCEAMFGNTGKTYFLESDEYKFRAETLGTEYTMLDLVFKPYTCCRWAHMGILASITMMQTHSFTHKDIEKVVVNTFEAASRLSKIIPKDTDEAQYNIAFPIASAIVHGNVGFMEIRNEALDNADVIEVMGKMSFNADPEITKYFPATRYTNVEFTLKDGRVLKSENFEAKGEKVDNVDMTWIREKFERLIAPFMTKDEITTLFEMMSKDDGKICDIVTHINNSMLK